ncbi:aldo/keto reductase [Amycolatopsis acidiphila]|uniref:Oxidoreductase n=1 Tax=Amycolatopsis acidiphila TaxID=715473 RepID=A0A558A345_9PSEU|nr:aldo/keto reductase [Amycolatopsis acidiphila]TVT18680.1 oxidoreductase [Amycolatopsis acidiphila]UIJ61582.1 aldo/keto reductase [Amycolatopsis acidiphila]GHG59094.1 oxidoreductase [Amycolatopsis acidiphila]
MTDIQAAPGGTFQLGGDLPVHRLGYGAMQITGPGVWGEPEDRDGALAVLRAAVDLGVNFIDTADSYGPYVSEELICEALYPYPDDLVIATKGGFVRTGPDQWVPLGRPAYLRQEVEMSLRRLRLERIDLYQLHRVDPEVPLEDQVGELRLLRDEGKIRHIGLSEVDSAQIEQARDVTEIASVQNLYNLADRRHEAVLDYATSQGIAFIPWFPIATGKLAEPGSVLEQAAKGHSATPAQLALAWLLRRSPVMLPIPGTRSVRHLEENVAAAAVQLTDEEFESLSALTEG